MRFKIRAAEQNTASGHRQNRAITRPVICPRGCWFLNCLTTSRIIKYHRLRPNLSDVSQQNDHTLTDLFLRGGSDFFLSRFCPRRKYFCLPKNLICPWKNHGHVYFYNIVFRLFNIIFNLSTCGMAYKEGPRCLNLI